MPFFSQTDSVFEFLILIVYDCIRESYLCDGSFLAPIVAKSPQGKKKLIFVDFSERPAEAPEKAYKNAFFAADLQRKAGVGF